MNSTEPREPIDDLAKLSHYVEDLSSLIMSMCNFMTGIQKTSENRVYLAFMRFSLMMLIGFSEAMKFGEMLRGCHRYPRGVWLSIAIDDIGKPMRQMGDHWMMDIEKVYDLYN